MTKHLKKVILHIQSKISIIHSRFSYWHNTQTVNSFNIFCITYPPEQPHKVDIIFLVSRVSKEHKGPNNGPQVTELQQQSHISNAFFHTKHPRMPTSSTDPVFPGELQWECESMCSFYDSTHPSSYIETGSKGPALATAGSFKEQHRGALETIHLPSHTGRPSRACHSHCQAIQINISQIISSLSFLLASPIFFPLQFPKN